MKKSLLLFVLLFSLYSFKQDVKKNNPPEHLYFFCAFKIDTKQKLAEVEELLKKKPEVVYFNCNDFPAAYFKLITNKEINQETFNSWIGSAYATEFFEEGEMAEKHALIYHNENKN
jgi:hypothetical protein